MSGHPKTWRDASGVRRLVPLGRLHSGGKRANKQHLALRCYVFERDGLTCLGCGAKAMRWVPSEGWASQLSVGGIGALVLDHIVPRSRGGSNHPKNLQTLCESCNCSKGALPDKLWRGSAA